MRTSGQLSAHCRRDAPPADAYKADVQRVRGSSLGASTILPANYNLATGSPPPAMAAGARLAYLQPTRFASPVGSYDRRDRHQEDSEEKSAALLEQNGERVTVFRLR